MILHTLGTKIVVRLCQEMRDSIKYLTGEVSPGEFSTAQTLERTGSHALDEQIKVLVNMILSAKRQNLLAQLCGQQPVLQQFFESVAARYEHLLPMGMQDSHAAFNQILYFIPENHQSEFLAARLRENMVGMRRNQIASAVYQKIMQV